MTPPVVGWRRRWRISYLVPLSHRLRSGAADCSIVNARSALFDVYGDHLLSRGGQAPVASLVAMMAPLDIAAPAVRTAISRMVAQGWLASVRLPRGRRLRAHPARRASPGRGRGPHLPAPRRRRGTALAPARRSTGSPSGPAASGSATGSATSAMRRCATTPGSARGDPTRSTRCCRPTTYARRRFVAAHDGDDAELAAATWDLDGLGGPYRRWLADARQLVERLGAEQRRPGRIRDPQPLGARVAQVPVPRPWAAARAAARRTGRATRPRRTSTRRRSGCCPAAGRYVDACLRAPAAANGGAR